MTKLEIFLIILSIYLFTWWKIKNRKIENPSNIFEEFPNELAYVVAPIFLVGKIIENIFKFIFDEWYPPKV